MTIEFIGISGTTPGSEFQLGGGPVVQPEYLRELALAHEAAGFDKVLTAHSSSMPDGFIAADQVLQATTTLGVLLAHRPGFVAPTIAARAYATLDAFHPGRIAFHTITGGDDADQARDGDFTDKVTRYRRTDEFLDVLRKEWESETPFSYEGEFYQVKDGWSSVRPQQPIQIYFGGASADAIRVGGKHADVYAFWGEPIAGIIERIREVRAAAAPYGRNPRFSVSLRPIVADTEAEAWRRAQDILEATEETFGEIRKLFKLSGSEQVGSQRLLRYADEAEIHDKRLWTALAKATGAVGNSTALVGSYEQVAESLVDYVDVGASTLLIRGFDPVADARRYGNLIHLVREQRAEAFEPVAV